MAEPLIALPPSWFTLLKGLSLGMSKYLCKMTWKAGTSAFSLIGGLLEFDSSKEEKAACLSM